MSGGNGGSGGSGGFVPPKPKSAQGGGAAANRCDISVHVPLSATNPANIKKVKLGDLLKVEIRTSRSVDSVVALVPTDASVVGSIAYRGVEDLIECLNEGFEYVAEIILYSPISIKVHVKRK